MAADRRDRVEAVLQRRAMIGMMLAMLVMALGVPLHVAALRGSHTSLPAIDWLSAALTTLVIVIAIPALTPPHLDRSGAFVLACAAAAYAVGVWALLAPRGHGALFDVAAMALAWLLDGRARSAALDRRFHATRDQLAPLLNLPPIARSEPPRDRRWWIGLLIAALVLGVALLLDRSARDALTILALACPATLGIAREAPRSAGWRRALRAGWLIDPAALCDTRSTEIQALRLADAATRDLRVTRRHVAIGTRWALGCSIGGNVLLAILALWQPIDPLAPALLMIAAWLLITLIARRVEALPHAHAAPAI